MRFRSSEVARLVYPAVLEELDAAIIVLDKQLRIVGINPSGRSLLHGEMGNPSNQAIEGGWEQWLQTTASSIAGTPLEQSLTFTNGSTEQVFSLRVTPIHDHLQEVAAFVFVMRDITYVKLATEGLNLAHRKFDSLFNFIHELRTPLNGILGLAEMLDLGALGPLDDKQSNAAQRILERSEYITDLINEFVNQCRSDYEQLELILKEMNKLE